MHIPARTLLLLAACRLCFGGAAWKVEEIAPMTATGVKKRVMEIIRCDAVVIFSKSFCKYSLAAKAFFAELEQEVRVVELDEVLEGPQIQSALLRMTDQCTVPNVFVNGKSIGGNDKVRELAASGELQPLLDAANAAARSRPRCLDNFPLHPSEEPINDKTDYCAKAHAERAVLNAATGVGFGAALGISAALMVGARRRRRHITVEMHTRSGASRQAAVAPIELASATRWGAEMDATVHGHRDATVHGEAAMSCQQNRFAGPSTWSQ